MSRMIAMLLLVAAVCAPVGAKAGEETRVYPFVLSTDQYPEPVYEPFVGSWHCIHPAQNEEIPIAARYCPAIPLQATSVEIRAENLATGTDLDPALLPVAMVYGTNYWPGPRGSFCGSATIALDWVPDINPRLIFKPRGAMTGPQICGGLTTQPGIALAGQIVVTFRW